MSPIDESLDIDVVEEAKKVQMADPEVGLRIVFFHLRRKTVFRMFIIFIILYSM